MAVIITKHLRKTYRSRGNKKLLSGFFKPNWQYKDAVEDVSFVIESGEAVAFLGPNGAGKTTTTKMLTGLIHPTKGAVRVLGYTPFERNHDFLRKIGLVMGNKSGLNWDLTANQSFELLIKIYRIDPAIAAQRLKELTTMLQVDHVLNTQVRQLSLGERMKLELIGAILHDPEVLFLDEPTIGLDINSKKTMRSFLRTLHASGKTLLLTSHDMDDINEICERVIVVNHGRIMYDDKMAALNKNYAQTRYIKLEFSNSVPSRAELVKFGQVTELNDSQAIVGVHKSNVMEIAAQISQRWPVQDVTIEQVPLEVIISDLYSKRPRAS